MSDTGRLDELQGNVSDVIEASREITDSLDCAESCETMSDYAENINEAITAAQTLLRELKKLR